MIFRTLLLLLFFLCFSMPGIAQEYDLFTCKNIETELSGMSPDQARIRALKDTPRLALKQLFQKLTAQSDWDRLPTISDEELQRLTMYVGIDQEKTFPTRYVANLSVRFRPEAIRTILRNADIAFAEWRGKPVMVIPILQTEAGPIWDGPANIWRDQWKYLGTSRIVPFVPASQDMLLDNLPLSRILNDREVAKNLTQELYAPDVIIAIASLQKDNNNKTAIDITINANGPIASILSGTRSYLSATGENQESLMKRGINDLLKQAEDEWKRIGFAQPGQIFTMTIDARVKDLHDWIEIHEKINRITAIISYDIISLSRNNVTLFLHMSGEQPKIGAVFSQHGLKLTPKNERFILSQTPPPPAPKNKNQETGQ